MPAPSSLQIIKSLTSIAAYRILTPLAGDTLGDTTTTAATTSPDPTVAVASILNFADGDPAFNVGSGGLELLEIMGAPALAMPLRRPALIAQDTGSRFVEAVRIPLGHIVEGSASFGGGSSSTPIPAATSATPVGSFFVAGALTGKFSLLNFTARSLALAFGQNETTSGTGTSADPTTQIINGQTRDTAGLLSFRGAVVLKDGSFAEVDFLDCTVAGTVDVNISGKTVAPIPIAFDCTAHAIRWWR